MIYRANRIVVTIALFLAPYVTPQQPPNDMNPVNGLRMSITRQANADAQARIYTVTFTNATKAEMTLIPGTLIDCGVAPSRTSAVRLMLTDTEGKQHRHMQYLGDGPPYVGYCAGQIEPFVVVLHARESVSLPLDLGKYFDLTDAKQYEMARFHAGDYTLQAEFTMRPSNSKTVSPSSTNVWSGLVYSNTVQVHFDSEFGAPNADYRDDP